MPLSREAPLRDPALVEDLVNRILVRRAGLADALQFA